MRHQGILRELDLFRLTLRKLGPLYFVPHLFLYGLIPLLGAGYSTFRNSCPSSAAGGCFSVSQAMWRDLPASCCRCTSLLC